MSLVLSPCLVNLFPEFINISFFMDSNVACRFQEMLMSHLTIVTVNFHVNCCTSDLRTITNISPQVDKASCHIAMSPC